MTETMETTVFHSLHSSHLENLESKHGHTTGSDVTD